jgi:hypothetical protein
MTNQVALELVPALEMEVEETAGPGQGPVVVMGRVVVQELVHEGSVETAWSLIQNLWMQEKT